MGSCAQRHRESEIVSPEYSKSLSSPEKAKLRIETFITKIETAPVINLENNSLYLQRKSLNKGK